MAFREYSWVTVDDDCRKLELRWVLPGNKPISNSFLEVGFREYVPDTSQTSANVPVDTTTYHWKVGDQVITVELPPFAIYDAMALQQNVEHFILRCQPQVETWITENFRNELARLTYKEAFRYRQEHSSSLIQYALQMQCGAIMSQGFGSVTGNQTFGIPEIDYAKYGQSGYSAYDREKDRPLPQAMGHQMDVAILLTINKWQELLIRGLKDAIFRSKNKPWYELFLTMFILLSNMEYIHGGAVSYKRVKMKTVSGPLQ